MGADRNTIVTIQGLHHITLVSANAQRTVDVYVGVLGLRLVKLTVYIACTGEFAQQPQVADGPRS